MSRRIKVTAIFIGILPLRPTRELLWPTKHITYSMVLQFKVQEFNNTIIAYTDPRIPNAKYSTYTFRYSDLEQYAIEAHRVYSQDETQQACNHKNMSQSQEQPCKIPCLPAPITRSGTRHI